MAVESAPPRLVLQLSARDGLLEVRATSRHGEARGETVAPETRLLDPLDAYEPGDYPDAVVAPLGRALAGCLLGGDVGKLAADLLAGARAAGRSVQFELRFDPDQVALARFPWEMIRNDQGEYLVREGLVDLTRYVTYPQPPPVFDTAVAEQPLLRVIAAPGDLAALEFGDLGLTHVETLRNASFTALTHRLLMEGQALWGLQFDGHGALLPQCSRCDALSLPTARFCRACGQRLDEPAWSGALAFERGGKLDWVAASEFGSLLYNARVRLAVLLACESARVGDKLIWSGLAPKLLLAGVPAVLGMQYPVYDDYANLFARTFYGALLRTGDAVAALRAARRADVREAWYSPVLYLRQTASAPESTTLPAFQQRAVDTAVPEAVEAGTTFLVRLWIRRPDTPPLDEARLRHELDVPDDIGVQTQEHAAEVKFMPVPHRVLRRGEVLVTLFGINCEVLRGAIMLFVDEHLDAPPAIFAVRATSPRAITLVWELSQDSGVIASITHRVAVHAPAVGMAAGGSSVAVQSHTLPVRPPELTAPQPPPEPARPPPQPAPAQSRPEMPPSVQAPGTMPSVQAGSPGPLPPAPYVEPLHGGRHVGTDIRQSGGQFAPALAAGAWASAGALKTLAGPPAVGEQPVSRPIDLVLGLVAGVAIVWSLRRAGARFGAGQSVLLATAWALAWALLPFISATLGAGVLAGIGGGVLSGALGGAITGLLLGRASGLGVFDILLVTGAWIAAFALAQLFAPAIASSLPPLLTSAIFWGLIAAIGTALTVRLMRDE